MNYYKFALWLSAASVILLILIVFSPTEYMVLQWRDLIFSAGILFPLLMFSWICALFALAPNFVHAERLFIEQEERIPRRKKYFPSLLCIPAVTSFFWFCYKFFKGFTTH